MTRAVIAVGPEASLADVVQLMDKHRIKRVPVIRDGRLVGIVSRADLLRALIRKATAEPRAEDTSDAAIEGRINAEIERQPWGPATMTHVVVQQGVAELQGVLIDDRERDALRVLVENEPGVTRVLDRLSTIEAMIGTVVQSAPDR